MGIRKKVRAEKSSNRRKSRTFFRSNFFPPNFFWFIWNQMCYNNGRPLILKPVPNHEEWDDKLAWFSWNWQRKSMLKWNVTVLCFLSKLIKAHKLGLSCAKLSRSCSRTFSSLVWHWSIAVILSSSVPVGSWVPVVSWTKTSPINTVRTTHPPPHPTPPEHIW